MGTFRSGLRATSHVDLRAYRKVLGGDDGTSKLFDIVRLLGGQAHPWLTFVLGSGCLASAPTHAPGAEALDETDVRRGLEEFGIPFTRGTTTCSWRHSSAD